MLLLFKASPVAPPQLDVRSYFNSDRLLDTFRHFAVVTLPKLLVIALIAYVLVRLLGFFTVRLVRIAERHSLASSRLSQARTLSSVLRATGIGLISFLAVLEALPLLGFDLGPLLASAGIAGVAVGLACQAIVKDFINGMLILLEDQYNVGDWITVAGLTGQVESLTLRKTTLRDGDGTLYTVPNSQITTVANKTRDYSVATVNVDVDFSAKPDEVIKVLTDTAMSVRNDPRFKDVFLADPTLLGVDGIKGSQVTYPILLKTLANQQWGPKRELQRRVRNALADNNMLPGDPLRVFTADGPRALGAQAHQLNASSATAPNPTAAPGPKDNNPFTGEGL